MCQKANARGQRKQKQISQPSVVERSDSDLVVGREGGRRGGKGRAGRGGCFCDASMKAHTTLTYMM